MKMANELSAQEVVPTSGGRMKKSEFRSQKSEDEGFMF